MSKQKQKVDGDFTSSSNLLKDRTAKLKAEPRDPVETAETRDSERGGSQSRAVTALGNTWRKTVELCTEHVRPPMRATMRIQAVLGGGESFVGQVETLGTAPYQEAGLNSEV